MLRPTARHVEPRGCMQCFRKVYEESYTGVPPRMYVYVDMYVCIHSYIYIGACVSACVHVRT